jgi:hypothetical protein
LKNIYNEAEAIESQGNKKSLDNQGYIIYNKTTMKLYRNKK